MRRVGNYARGPRGAVSAALQRGVRLVVCSIPPLCEVEFSAALFFFLRCLSVLIVGGGYTVVEGEWVGQWGFWGCSVLVPVLVGGSMPRK